MSEHPYITLILPAYNEVAVIGESIARAVCYFEERQFSYEIIVAADGEDGTRERVARLGETNSAIKVIGQRVRCGKGYAIRKAVEVSRGSIIGYADADWKVPLDDFDKVVPLLERGSSVVIGSRALQRSLIERAQPLYRRIGSRGFRIFMRTVVGLSGISDSQCGFKFFQRPVALELFRRQHIDGYMFDVEVLALAQSLGFQISEVPVRWRDDGDSRLELLSGNIRNVADIFRIAWALHRTEGEPQLVLLGQPMPDDDVEA